MRSTDQVISELCRSGRRRGQLGSARGGQARGSVRLTDTTRCDHADSSVSRASSVVSSCWACLPGGGLEARNRCSSLEKILHNAWSGVLDGPVLVVLQWCHRFTGTAPHRRPPPPGLGSSLRTEDPGFPPRPCPPSCAGRPRSKPLPPLRGAATVHRWMAVLMRPTRRDQ